MAVLQIAQRACLLIDLERPSSLYASTDRTMQELGDTINVAATQILDDYDWQALIRTASVVGDGVVSAFDLPSDYSRMVKDANLWGQSIQWVPSQQMQDYNHWLELETYSDLETWNQRWMIFGNQLHVRPVVPSLELLRYGYITKNIVNGADQTQFTADTDEFVLDDELLRLSIVWNWKKSKGFDFQADLAQYAERLEKLRFRDVGARQTIITGRGYGRRWPTGQSFP